VSTLPAFGAADDALMAFQHRLCVAGKENMVRFATAAVQQRATNLGCACVLPLRAAAARCLVLTKRNKPATDPVAKAYGVRSGRFPHHAALRRRWIRGRYEWHAARQD